jgi:hypothetical protein
MNGNDAGLKLLSQRQSRGHGFGFSWFASEK